MRASYFQAMHIAIWSDDWKWEEIQTFQCYASKLSSRGSTVMFELSKYFSQLYLEIYQDEIDFLSFKHLKARNKMRKISSLFFFVIQSQTLSLRKVSFIFIDIIRKTKRFSFSSEKIKKNLKIIIFAIKTTCHRWWSVYMHWIIRSNICNLYVLHMYIYIFICRLNFACGGVYFIA